MVGDVIETRVDGDLGSVRSVQVYAAPGGGEVT